MLLCALYFHLKQTSEVPIAIFRRKIGKKNSHRRGCGTPILDREASLQPLHRKTPGLETTCGGGDGDAISGEF
jgi:hypothetical protein